jgi:hypothetical protein
VVVVILVAVVATWSLLLFRYSTQPTGSDQPAPAVRNGITAVIEPMEFRAIDDKMLANLQLTANGDLVDSRGILQENLVVTLRTDVSSQEFVFERGNRLETEEVLLSVVGNIQDYPGDTYTGTLTLTAERLGGTAEGTTATAPPVAVPVAVGVVSAIDGWTTTITPPATAELDSITAIRTERAPFSVRFAWAILALITVLPVLGLAVGWLFITNRRVAYLEYLSWFIGLVLALPFLRRVLPGDPPLGCRIDVAVFFWCLVGAMVAMVLAVTAWYLQSGQRLRNGVDQEPGPTHPPGAE